MKQPPQHTETHTLVQGQAMPHDSAALHVTGTARYLDDIRTPQGTLVLVPGLSAIASGQIKKCNLTHVQNAPGIIAVLTAKDIPGQNDVSPGTHDDPMLLDGHINSTVSYHGQIIYAVVAESTALARDAMKKAEIEYETQTPILTIDDALKHSSLLDKPLQFKKGDAPKALSDAPRKISGTLRVGGQEHFYLEGQAALAIPEEQGQILLYVSSQNPTEIQHKVAEALAIPNHAVHVEVRRMGGGFGGKETQGNQPACLAALAAHITQRPVKMVYDRDDDMKITGKRHDIKIDYQAGFDDQGKILSVIFDQALRCGMSFDLSRAVGGRAALHADNAYHIPNMTITSYLCKTNTPSNTAFRGFGSPQGMMGIERVIDHIAHELNLDPLTVRERNFYPDHDAPNHGTTHYGQVVADGIINDLTARLTQTSDYKKRRQDIDAFNLTQAAENKPLRRGIALTPVKFGVSFNRVCLNQSGALVHVYTDGSVLLNHGGTEMGQGLFTKVKQITAAAFGIDASDVRTTPTHTAKVPNTSATAASVGSDLNGMAAWNASQTIKARMADYLATLYQIKSKQVTFANGDVHIGQEKITFADAANLCWQGRISLSSTGYYATPDIHWDAETRQGMPFYYYAYGAAVSEVAVDMLTGENRLLQVDILHDAGASLNPALDLGQIEGGYIQAVGWLTTEELVYAEDGRLLTHAPSTYKIPACSDRPLKTNIDFYPSQGNHSATIGRSKAVGEPPFMLGMSAFFALSHAIRHPSKTYTYPMLDAPATPERLFMTALKTQTSQK